ncbi:hypothetical protein HNQ71_000768 [Mesorhizobium sangaii]|uniref:Uncharacterized protein n=1 Tax=Mesorhizobium sangaii TaxID=505389 RepID=A0A841NYI0_9HYPH|nr:hypothetical protein [Mesorhizobium sangaii]
MPYDLTASGSTEYNRAIVFAYFHRYDTVIPLPSGKGRKDVVPRSLLGIEWRLFNDALFPIPNHCVGHRCDAPYSADPLSAKGEALGTHCSDQPAGVGCF